MLNSYWTIEKIDLALQRGELAASCEMPIEHLRALLLIARDMLELSQKAKAYDEKYILNPCDKRTGILQEYLEIFTETLEKY